MYQKQQSSISPTFKSILLPIKLGERACKISIDDALHISAVANFPYRLKVSTTTCAFITDVDMRFKNEYCFMSYLKRGSTDVRVFAVFRNHVLVEIPLDTIQYHFYNYGNL
jgi:hypothetical protein